MLRTTTAFVFDHDDVVESADLTQFCGLVFVYDPVSIDYKFEFIFAGWQIQFEGPFFITRTFFHLDGIPL